VSARGIHLTGASGSGTTTLGRALAAALGRVHLDADDFYWRPSDPPYEQKRAPSERLRLLREGFRMATGAWVLSGSLVGWGDEIIPELDAVVFLTAPTDVRIERLRRREAERYGADAIAPGGARHAACEEFLAWAAEYDDGGMEIRSRRRHEAWLAALPCLVLRIDGTWPTDEQVRGVRASLA
jgi:adenylate kinase family enzyme